MDVNGYYIKKDNTNISPIVSEKSVIGSSTSTSRWDDTNWWVFSEYDSTYLNASQSSYSMDKWRVKDNVLYVSIGYGVSSSSTVNSTTEVEIAQIPIIKSGYDSSDGLVWSPMIGYHGYWAGGVKLYQKTDYISVIYKPHTSSYATVGTYGGTYFSVPLDDGWSLYEDENLALCQAMSVYMNKYHPAARPYGTYYAEIDEDNPPAGAFEVYVNIISTSTSEVLKQYLVNYNTLEIEEQ